MGYAWWSVVPPPMGVLTVENLQEGYKRIQEEGWVPPVLWMHPVAAHYYRCVLARMYWKHAYREFRMFRTACEKGWLG